MVRIWNSIDAHLKNGSIVIRFRGKTISLDSTAPLQTDIAFISHAHYDHLPRRVSSTVLASNETVELARIRGLPIKSHINKAESLKLIDSGHILGSRALLVDDDLLYTGDFAGRPRAFLSKLISVKCKTLIVEATYGKPGIVFPSVAKVMGAAMDSISRAYELGNGIVLEGYTLGKAQLLNYMFQTWRPIFVHPKIEAVNQIYRKFGVAIPMPDKVVDDIGGLIHKGPFVFIAPMNIHLRSDVPMIKFTGWAHNASRSSLPLSDHADFQELITYIKKANPERILTIYGFDRGLAEELRRQGFYAKSVSDLQTDILDYT